MSERYMTLDGLCRQLSISRATGRNWLRLGKIESQGRLPDGRAYFTEEYVRRLEESLRTGERNTLRSRRNKQYVSGKGLYDRYVSDGCEGVNTVKKLADMLKAQKVCVTETAMRALLADCALKLLVSSGMCTSDTYKFPDPLERGDSIPDMSGMLQAYIQGDFTAGIWSLLIDDIIHDKENISAWIGEHRELMNADYEYQAGEDLPGLLYISIRDMGSRKASGSYYTPTDIVRKMVADVISDMGEAVSGKRLLDPCCGTGNFLIQLPENIELRDIYAFDIDLLSVQLARFNLALCRAVRSGCGLDETDIRMICGHIACRDFLFIEENPGYMAVSKTAREDFMYDVIIGNPPWGYKFDTDMQRYLRKTYKAAAGRGTESYDVFVERALELLRDGGILAFVLPEALFGVKNHSKTRNLIAGSANVQRVSFLGDVFHGVQCPAVVLQLEKSSAPGHSEGAVVENKGRVFVIGVDRPLDGERFVLRLSDEEYRLLCKIEHTDNCATLRGQADFALGIVTGDNRRYVSDMSAGSTGQAGAAGGVEVRMEAGTEAGTEAVVTGPCVHRYRYDEPGKFIPSDLTIYQQAAPAELYHAPEKLIYRFINRQLVFAYDDRQRLTLNSCNVVIPHVPGLDVKYIMAVLNSRAAQYIYEKRFNAVKVLRSHIEYIPIPLAEENIRLSVTAAAEKLMELGRNPDQAPQAEQYRLYDEIDDMVRHLYKITDEEYEFLKRSLTGGKYML